jgi:hypothetical protein
VSAIGKERPILFSAPMVRALLDGSKTQTRRIVKPQPHIDAAGNFCVGKSCYGQDGAGRPVTKAFVEWHCPHGKPGDRLWVRETWAQPAALDPGPTVYRADYPACVLKGYENVPAVDDITWKPSIHMFRRDSRVLLEIVSVRVERLDDCSAADAVAEGIRRVGPGFERWHPDPADVHHTGSTQDPLLAYRGLWESINGAGSWAANPWVWVVEFKRVAT